MTLGGVGPRVGATPPMARTLAPGRTGRWETRLHTRAPRHGASEGSGHGPGRTCDAPALSPGAAWYVRVLECVRRARAAKHRRGEARL